jgi:hypothetical protein
MLNLVQLHAVFYIRMVLQQHKISQNILQDVRAGPKVLSVRLSSPGRHPKTSGFDVAEGRI